MKALLLKCSLGIFVLSLAFIACKKSSQSFESKGVISPTIVFDCAACDPVYNIKFSTDTQVYQISNNLAQFGITKDTKLPVNVSVNWKRDGSLPDAYYVIITALKVNN